MNNCNIIIIIIIINDKDFTLLHYSMCKALGIETTDKWYTHMPKPVCEEGDVTVNHSEAPLQHSVMQRYGERSGSVRTPCIPSLHF